ncbi:MAG: 23S rRNA (uracil(1939)-C(5))-methyltransferase RlmD [Deltaproteobacteria bacterium]|nr:MAG: 23S rRNA (uracil(1939)-C(5))-methyltransferase RlmD [Deltaproteobacteria bacterium]
MTPVQEPAAFPPLIKGAEFDLMIDKVAFGGKALGRVNGLVVFVDRAVPGQKVRVRVTRTKKHFAEARVVRILTQSPAYAPPFCPHFGLCGGCQWQDFAYEEQLRWKRLHVQESLQHLAGLQPGMILPTVPSPETRYYRNKMEFAFAPGPWQPATQPAAGKGSRERGCALGLHVRFSAEGIFNLEHCFLQSTQTPAIVQEVRRWCGASGLPAYNTKNHRGFWRFLVLREGKRTAQTLVQIITTDQGDPQAVEALGRHLQAHFPGFTTMVHSRSVKKAQVASGEVSRTLWGPGYIEERLGRLHLRISAHSFLQTNTYAAAGLYDAVSRLGEFNGRETVWDLYCGAGSIGLSLASRVRQVVGFELVEQAVADAYTNSRLNGIGNCRFLAGDLKERMREVLRTGSQPLPEVVITDPPRAGMHPRVAQALRELSPRRIIYVSCNPATLARDLALLKDGYEVLAVQPFDLFPHTSHIECVVRLEKRDKERKRGHGLNP